jgi:hypothetical protein
MLHAAKSVTLSTMPSSACNTKDSIMTDTIIGYAIHATLGVAALYTLAYMIGLV